MELVEGYDHQPGTHCGAAALRNITQYYGWRYTEAACFGIGGGPAFVRYDHPEESWATFRTSPTWLERAFFERVGVPHLSRTEDTFETAWDNVTARIDEDDPVILFLDPASLSYLPGHPPHLPPHVAVLIGYDDETVQLSDGSMENRQEVSHETLRDAWTTDRFVPLSYEYLAVTRARRTNDGTDSAAAGIRQTATYMLEPLQIQRDARSPGDEGLPALRSFADELGTWADHPNSAHRVRAARRSIDGHGDGTAFRGLYAESLAELGQRTGLAHDLADRMAGVGERWRTVVSHLDDILETDDPSSARFEEAASLVSDIANREQALFEAIADELGWAGGQRGV